MKNYGKILVACPTHECKRYAEQRWNENVHNFTYPNFDVIVVDNSPAPRFTDFTYYPLQWIGGDQDHAMLRITQSMEVIRQYFLAGGYSRWFNCEIDVIPPRDVIQCMLELGGNTDWISHAYPMRGGDTDDQQGIGCSMLSRNLMQDFNFSNAGDNSPDGWLWQQVRPSRKYTTMELWGYFKVEHLAQ